MNISLIVTDASPLMTLAAAGSLDVLLLSRQRVIVPDMVRYEIVRFPEKPGATEIMGQNLQPRRVGGRRNSHP